MELTANFIDILKRKISFSLINIENGKISGIKEIEPTERKGEKYILPGFIDAHVHIESSLLCPAQFARLAVVHGTVGTVSDPHEIANVMGVEGIKFMLNNASKVPFKFCFGAPPCVPATPFETAGAKITANDIQYLFEKYPQIGYLAEVMNFPGVLNGDADMLEKIKIAKAFNKPIDGHAPGLMGKLAKKYTEAGPKTDHECFTKAEALDKLAFGMKILIREGSAAKNFDALIDLLPEHYENLMFCSDDKHPDELAIGHINLLVKRALGKGFDLFEILKVASINPVLHYNLPIGLLNIGDPADFILVDNLLNFNVLATYLNGNLVAENGISFIKNIESEIINNFNVDQKNIEEFQLKSNNAESIKVIEVIDGQLITNSFLTNPIIANGYIEASEKDDILKIAVVNRYENKPVAIAFVKNFGIKSGAIASSVAHDSHNIISVGSSDALICEAVNKVINEKGGLSAVSENSQNLCLPLPLAGIMSNLDGYKVAEKYAEIDQFSKKILKSTLKSPFMSLSFMALLVIPKLKLSDKGLFDVEKFEFTSVFN